MFSGLKEINRKFQTGFLEIRASRLVDPVGARCLNYLDLVLNLFGHHNWA
jgi:hypothetical protein